MIPEPNQLDLFGNAPANESTLLQPVAECTNDSVEIHNKDPTDEDIEYNARNLEKSIERARSLLIKSRELVKKSWENKK